MPSEVHAGADRDELRGLQPCRRANRRRAVGVIATAAVRRRCRRRRTRPPARRANRPLAWIRSRRFANSGRRTCALDALVVSRGPRGVRVERARVGEARAIAGADAETAAVEHAADERVDRPFGAEQALGRQNAALRAASAGIHEGASPSRRARPRAALRASPVRTPASRWRGTRGPPRRRPSGASAPAAASTADGRSAPQSSARPA